MCLTNFLNLTVSRVRTLSNQSQIKDRNIMPANNKKKCFENSTLFEALSLPHKAINTMESDGFESIVFSRRHPVAILDFEFVLSFDGNKHLPGIYTCKLVTAFKTTFNIIGSFAPVVVSVNLHSYSFSGEKLLLNYNFVSAELSFRVLCLSSDVSKTESGWKLSLFHYSLGASFNYSLFF